MLTMSYRIVERVLSLAATLFPLDTFIITEDKAIHTSAALSGRLVTFTLRGRIYTRRRAAAHFSIISHVFSAW